MGKKEDKSVTVEEILALVATTPKPSRRPVPARVKRWRSAELLKSDSAESSDDDDHKPRSSNGAKNSKEFRERSRERCDSSRPRKKSRSRSRRLTRTRKGTQEESSKESRRPVRNRRGSNK